MPDRVLAGRHRAHGRHRAAPRPLGQRSAAAVSVVWLALMMLASMALAVF